MKKYKLLKKQYGRGEDTIEITFTNLEFIHLTQENPIEGKAKFTFTFTVDIRDILDISISKIKIEIKDNEWNLIDIDQLMIHKDKNLNERYIAVNGRYMPGHQIKFFSQGEIIERLNTIFLKIVENNKDALLKKFKEVSPTPIEDNIKYVICSLKFLLETMRLFERTYYYDVDKLLFKNGNKKTSHGAVSYQAASDDSNLSDEDFKEKHDVIKDQITYSDINNINIGLKPDNLKEKIQKLIDS